MQGYLSFKINTVKNTVKKTGKKTNPPPWLLVIPPIISLSFLIVVFGGMSLHPPTVAMPTVCSWTNPVTDEVTPLSPAEGQSCFLAKQQAQKDHIKNEYGGDEKAYLHAINEKNNKKAYHAESASKKAEKSSELQKYGGVVAFGGAAWAATKAYACCPSTSACTSHCPYFVALAAGLAGAGGYLMTASSKNYKNANILKANPYIPGYSGGDGSTIPVPNLPATTLNHPNSEITPINEEFPPTEEGPEISPPPIGGTGGPKYPPELIAKLNKLGKWFPKEQKITLPNGKSYYGKDMDQALAHLPASTVKALKSKMDSMAHALPDNNSDDEDMSVAGIGGSGGSKGGSSGGGMGGSGGFDGGGYSSSSSGGSQLQASNNKKSRVAGMVVQRGNTRVGASMDNIFYMIHRRYQKKRQKREFFENMNY